MGSSVCLIGKIFIADDPLTASYKGFMCPPDIKAGFFHFLGECVNCYTMEPLSMWRQANTKIKKANLGLSVRLIFVI